MADDNKTNENTGKNASNVTVGDIMASLYGDGDSPDIEAAEKTEAVEEQPVEESKPEVSPAFPKVPAVPIPPKPHVDVAPSKENSEAEGTGKPETASLEDGKPEEPSTLAGETKADDDAKIDGEAVVDETPEGDAVEEVAEPKTDSDEKPHVDVESAESEKSDPDAEEKPQTDSEEAEPAEEEKTPSSEEEASPKDADTDADKKPKADAAESAEGSSPVSEGQSAGSGSETDAASPDKDTPSEGDFKYRTSLLDQGDAQIDFGITLADHLIIAFFAIVLGVLLCLPTFLGLTDTGTDTKSSSTSSYVVNGIAASAGDDVTVSEQEVLDEINNMRELQGVQDNAAWSEWLGSYGVNAEEVRKTIAENLATEKLMFKAATERGVEVTDEEVDAKIDEAKKSYTSADGTVDEEKFTAALKESGYTPETFRAYTKSYLCQKKLSESFKDEAPAPTDEEILEIATVYYADELENGSETKSLAEVPENIVTEIRDGLSQNAVYDAFYEWFENYIKSAEIQVNPMPTGLPYDVPPAAASNTNSASGNTGTSTGTGAGTSTGTTSSANANSNGDSASADGE